MKKRKFKLVKNIICTSLTLSLAALSVNKIKETKRVDNENFKTFIYELNSLEENESKFQNKKLLKYIKEQTNIKDIKQIESLTIDNKLLNDTSYINDLSDLKFLTNLKELEISNVKLNLGDLIYNQKLNKLTIKNSIIENSTNLPNSINNLKIVNTNIIDNYIVVPYNVGKLSLKDINANNIYFKNPKLLENFSINNATYFDISNLKECTNLKNLSIKKCLNVYNAEYLKTFSLDKLTVDDYASIWLKNDILTKIEEINSNIDENLKKAIRKLDKIARNLDIDSIKEYVLDKLKYGKNSNKKINYKEPISSILKGVKSISINYAALLCALANRIGLDVKCLYNNNYAWNIVDGQLVDLTKMDSGKYLVNNNEHYNSEPNIVDNINIGYIDKYEQIDKLVFSEEQFKSYLLPYILLMLGVNSLYITYNLEDKEDSKKLKKML